MGVVMRVYGEGSANDGTRRAAASRALVVALLLPLGSLGAGLVGGCANGSSDADSRVAAQTEPARPQQVVQRVEPTPVREPTSSPQSNGAAPSARDKRATVKGGRISSKHLEAELNRLEAELK